MKNLRKESFQKICVRMVFRCAPPCGCTPGRPDICDGTDCECDTHQLDPLTTQQLGDLVVKYSEYDVSDVCRKNKNQLFEMIYESGCGEAVLKAGVKLLRDARRQSVEQMRSQDVCTPEYVLQSIVDASDASSPSPRRSTPVARKLISPTICKNKKAVGKERVSAKKLAKKPAKKKPTKKPAKKARKKPCVT